MKTSKTELTFHMWDSVIVVPNEKENTIDINLVFNHLTWPKKGEVFYDLITANRYQPTFYFNPSILEKMGYGITYISESGTEMACYTIHRVAEGAGNVLALLRKDIPKRLIVKKTNEEIIGKPILAKLKEDYPLLQHLS